MIMDYYLYSHSNAGGIFYIGKGCGGRKDDYLRSRSAEWHEVAKHGYLTKMEATGTEECILSAEKMYIKLLIDQGVNLVNKIHNPNWKPTFTDEHKQKMSDAKSGDKNPMFGMTGDKNPMFGKTLSDETKKKMSDNHPDISGDKNPMFGRKRPDNSYNNKKRGHQ